MTDRRETRITSIVAQMTLDEKIRMVSGDQNFWSGMTALMKHDSYHRVPFPAARCERLGIGGLHFVDGPRGVVLVGGATTFPAAIARGATWDVDLEERIGDAIGKELRALGGNLFGGVCINLLRHPAWGRSQETFGECSGHVGAMGAALVRGVQRHAIACIKHLACNSMENARFQVDVRIAPRPLHEVYLPHFKEGVEAGAGAVMSAYNAVNGEWCGESAPLLTDILRTRWGFDGIVLTDFVFGMRDPVKAIVAGQDLEMPFRMIWGNRLRRLVRSGQVSEELLDRSVRRLVRVQSDLPDARDYPRSLVGDQTHRALARESATKSIVMLKNDGFLPITPGARIVVVGRLAEIPNLGDRGSSDTRPEHVVIPLEGLRQIYGDVAHFVDAEGAEAQRAIAAADAVVLIVGLTHQDEGEYVAPGSMHILADGAPPPYWLRWLDAHPVTRRLWRTAIRSVLNGVSAVTKRRNVDDAPFGMGGDRDRLALRPEDEDLISRTCALNPRTVTVVMGGGTVMMEAWRHKVPAILMLWYPGMEGGHALADIVSGKVSPSGRLPFVIPTDPAHLPFFDKNAERIDYDLLHGQRLLDREGHVPAFPFGFGLSYATFRYGGLSADQTNYRVGDTIELSLNVTNEADMAADEVVQFYLSVPAPSEERAERELKAFVRIALDGGQTKTVRCSLPVAKLAYFDERADRLQVEPTTYTILAARHALDADARQTCITIA